MIRANYYLRIEATILFGFGRTEQPTPKPMNSLLAFSTQRRQLGHSGQTFAHVQRCNDR